MPETGTCAAADDSWEYCLSIPNDPRAVTVSRRTLRLVLTLHGMIHLADTAELLTAELVGNAVRHTEGPAALRVRRTAGVLRIEAWDTDPAPPEPREPTADLQDGRGLMLVRAYADLWGWQPQTREGSHGKLVWCDLGTTRKISSPVRRS